MTKIQFSDLGDFSSPDTVYSSVAKLVRAMGALFLIIPIDLSQDFSLCSIKTKSQNGLDGSHRLPPQFQLLIQARQQLSGLWTLLWEQMSAARVSDPVSPVPSFAGSGSHGGSSRRSPNNTDLSITAVVTLKQKLSLPSLPPSHPPQVGSANSLNESAST